MFRIKQCHFHCYCETRNEGEGRLKVLGGLLLCKSAGCFVRLSQPACDTTHERRELTIDNGAFIAVVAQSFLSSPRDSRVIYALSQIGNKLYLWPHCLATE